MCFLPPFDVRAHRSGLMFSGRIADMYPRKILYLVGLSVFVLFSILSAVVKVGRWFIEAILGHGAGEC